LWRCGDGVLFKVHPLASDALVTTLHSLLENVTQTVCYKLQEEVFTLELPFNGWKSAEIAWDEIWTAWRMF
jgi:hypothetical protein